MSDVKAKDGLRKRLGLNDTILVLQQTVCCKKKTMIGWRNVWSMKWRVSDQEVDRRGLGQRLCNKSVKHVNWTGWMLWIVVGGGSW